MTERLILLGRVAGAFGVHGEMRITAHTDDPMALTRYSPLTGEDGSPALTLTGGRAVKGALIATVREVKTREEAQALRGLGLYVARAALPDPEPDEFYMADLIGLMARSPEGLTLGRVKAVNNFGAGDLLEIEPSDRGPSWWAPFTKAAAPEVRLAEGVIVIAQPEETEIWDRDALTRRAILGIDKP